MRSCSRPRTCRGSRSWVWLRRCSSATHPPTATWPSAFGATAPRGPTPIARCSLRERSSPTAPMRRSRSSTGWPGSAQESSAHSTTGPPGTPSRQSASRRRSTRPVSRRPGSPATSTGAASCFPGSTPTSSYSTATRSRPRPRSSATCTSSRRCSAARGPTTRRPGIDIRCRAVSRKSENGTLQLSYYDVPERRLSRAGATLSRRLEKGKGVWRFELERPDGGLARLEQPGGPSGPPSRMARALPALLRTEEPERVLRLRVHRNGSGTEVEVLEGLHAAERLDIAEDNLRDYVLAKLGGSDGPAAREPISHLREMLARQYEEILRQDVGVRLDLHPESVHKLRVAIR